MNKKGFTLVELMLVIIIIGIIGVITIPNIMEALDSSKKESGSSIEKVLLKDLELYNTDNAEDLWGDSTDAGCKSVSINDLLESNPDINLGECLLNSPDTSLTIKKARGENKYKYYVGITCSKNISSQSDNKYVVDTSKTEKSSIYYKSKSIECEGTKLIYLDIKDGDMEDENGWEPDENDDDGSVYTKEFIMGDEAPSFPVVNKPGYKLIGWKVNSGLNAEYIKEGDILDTVEDIKVEAIYEDQNAPEQPGIDIDDFDESGDVIKPKITLHCSDEGGAITGYYFGTTVPVGTSGYKRVSGSQSEVDIKINPSSLNEGKYYFSCKDNKENVSYKDGDYINLWVTRFSMVNGTTPKSVLAVESVNNDHMTVAGGFELPTPKANSGYSPKGYWYTSNNYSDVVKPYGDHYEPTSNRTLYSKADASKYRVNLIVVHGSGSTSNPVELGYGEGVTFNTSPDENYSNPKLTCTNGQTGTVTGGVVRISNVRDNTDCTLRYFDTILPTDIVMTSTNNVSDKQTLTMSCNDNVGILAYYFGTSAPTEGTSYNSTTETKTFSIDKEVNEDKTYYFSCKDEDGNVSATISKKFYKTSFDMKNGTVAPTSVLTAKDNSFNLPTPTANIGYTVKGNWYTNSSLDEGEIAYNTSYTPEDSDTLYSTSIINKSTLEIDPNGGSIVVNSPSDATGETITTSKSYTQNYNTKLKYSTPTKANDVDRSTSYTVSYDSNEGASTPESQTSIITKTTVYTFEKFVKSDTFYGELSESNKLYTYGPENNVNSKITATYKGITTSVPDKVVLADKPVREGYTFKGWKSSVDDRIYNEGVEFTPTRDTVMTAQWEINKYDVNITVNNGTVNGETSKVAIHNTDVTFEVTPSLENAPGSVSCTNGQNATLVDGVVTVTAVKNNTTCTVIYKTRSTVLFNDGTLIINELPQDRSNNVTSHGEVIKEYEALTESNAYVFTGGMSGSNSVIWDNEKYQIKSVTFGETVKPVSTAIWFKELRNMESGDFTKLDNSDNTSMNSMFQYAGYNCNTFRLTGLDTLDTSNVNDMGNVFNSAGFRATTWSIGDLSNWETNSVTTMSNMFNAAGYSNGSFNVGNLGNWDTSNVSVMDSMFANSGYRSSSWTVGDLSSWDTKNVTSMSSMFNAAGYSAGTFNLGDITSWNTKNVLNMSNMFNQAGYMATTWNVGSLSTWNTSKVNNMMQMFNQAAYSATTWNITDLSNWDTRNVTNLMSTFASAGYNITGEFSLDVSTWNVEKVVNMGYVFSHTGYNANKFNIDLSSWSPKVANGTPNMFHNAGYNATTWSVGDLSSWDTSNITNMDHMFAGAGYRASSFNIGNLSSWDTRKVENMDYMFNNAGYSSSSVINLGTLKVYAKGIGGMFYQTPKVKVTLELRKNPEAYSSAFTGASTVTGSLITVNYVDSVSDIDNIVATKSSNSNVVKGSVLS